MKNSLALVLTLLVSGIGCDAQKKKDSMDYNAVTRSCTVEMTDSTGKVLNRVTEDYNQKDNILRSVTLDFEWPSDGDVSEAIAYRYDSSGNLVCDSTIPGYGIQEAVNRYSYSNGKEVKYELYIAGKLVERIESEYQPDSNILLEQIKYNKNI